MRGETGKTEGTDGSFSEVMFCLQKKHVSFCKKCVCFCFPWLSFLNLLNPFDVFPKSQMFFKGYTPPPENQCQERLSSSFLPHTHGYPGIAGGIFQVSEQESPLDQPLLLPNSGSHDDLGLGFPTKNETFLVPVDPKNVSNPGSSNWAATNL